MKNIKHLFLIATIVSMVISCKKSKTDMSLNEEEISRHVIDDMKGEEKQVAYNTMTASEKYLYWKDRIDDYTAAHSFDSHQLTLINELLNSLSETVFSNQDQQEIYKNNFLNDWLVQATTTIGDYHLTGIGDLFSDPGTDVDPDSKYPVDGGGTTIPPCICNLNSDWTSRKRKVTVSVPPSYTVEYGICEYIQANGNCEETNWGCGFLGLWSCNGNHCQF